MNNDTPAAANQARGGDQPSCDLWLLWERKGLLVKCAAASLVLGAVYLVFAPKTYQAEARVLVQKDGLSLDRDDAVRAEQHFLETQAEVIRSPLTVSRALEMTSSPVPISAALRAITVTPVVDTNVLQVSYRGPQSTDPALTVRSIVDAFREQLKEFERGTYSNTLGLLAEQERDVRTELRDLEARYEELRQNSPLVGRGDDSFNVQTMQLRHLSERLAATKSRRLEMENKIQSFNLANRSLAGEAMQPVSTLANTPAEWQAPDPIRQGQAARAFYAAIADVSVYDSAAQQLLREEASSKIRAIREAERELGIARARLLELKRKFGHRHPDLLMVKEQVASWDRQLAERQVSWQSFLAERVDSLSAAIQQQIAIAKTTETAMAALLAEERVKVKQLDNFLLKDKLMLSNIERVERLHELTLTKLSDFQLADQALAGGRASVTVRLLEDPADTLRLIWPRPVLFLVLCGVMGLGAGAALIYFSQDQPLRLPLAFGPSPTATAAQL